jgi:hypothetical protein
MLICYIMIVLALLDIVMVKCCFRMVMLVWSPFPSCIIIQVLLFHSCDISCHFASQYLAYHTLLGTPRIAKFRGSLLLMSVILICIKSWNSKSNAYIKGELNLNLGIQSFISFIFCKPKLVVINYQKGRVCKCIRPWCGFWIINDNQIRD